MNTDQYRIRRNANSEEASSHKTFIEAMLQEPTPHAEIVSGDAVLAVGLNGAWTATASGLAEMQRVYAKTS